MLLVGEFKTGHFKTILSYSVNLKEFISMIYINLLYGWIQHKAKPFASIEGRKKKKRGTKITLYTVIQTYPSFTSS